MEDWQECKYGWNVFENDYKIDSIMSIKNMLALKAKTQKNI